MAPARLPADDALVELGRDYVVDEPADDPLTPGEDLVSLQELVELSGKVHATVKSRLLSLEAPMRRTRRGFVVPLAWARTHAKELLG